MEDAIQTLSFIMFSHSYARTQRAEQGWPVRKRKKKLACAGVKR
jgi:hypothetical protein